MKIVVLQPHYFPWFGVFDQLKHADIFIHYDDIPFPQGRSFLSRTQLKNITKKFWITVPIKKAQGDLNNNVCIDETADWRTKHQGSLKACLGKAPFFQDAFEIFNQILGSGMSLCDMNMRATELVADYLGLRPRFLKSSELGITGRSSQRLFDIMKALGGKTYITGHGAKNYLDYSLFEKAEMDVCYMHYGIKPYEQCFSPFDPCVSVLDLIAHRGKEALSHMQSSLVPWQDFLNHPHFSEVRRVA